jgi:hypothetical protein
MKQRFQEGRLGRGKGWIDLSEYDSIEPEITTHRLCKGDAGDGRPQPFYLPGF